MQCPAMMEGGLHPHSVAPVSNVTLSSSGQDEGWRGGCWREVSRNTPSADTSVQGTNPPTAAHVPRERSSDRPACATDP